MSPLLSDSRYNGRQCVGIEADARHARNCTIEMRNMVQAMIKADECPHPHFDDDSFWKDLYRDVESIDDGNSGQYLDKSRVIEARKLEIEHFRK